MCHTDRCIAARWWLEVTFSVVLLAVLLPTPVLSESSPLGGDFSLTKHDRSIYNLQDSRGKVVLIFFGYTHCPDICPNTLLLINKVLSELGERAKQVQPLFISVDPQRDSPEVLGAYLRYFHASLIGLTGSKEDLKRVAEQYQAFFKYAGDTRDTHYLVDHTASLYVIDASGVVARIIPYGMPYTEILHTVRQLLG